MLNHMLSLVIKAKEMIHHLSVH